MKQRKTLFRLIGVLSALAGGGLILYVVFPIFSYEISRSIKFPEYLSPIPPGSKMVVNEKANEERDFTKISNWFEEGAPSLTEEDSSIKFYTLDIPKLGIKNATVSIGGEDLAKSLIQYPGTALPGKRGNAVLFGHSVLPQFFNPKDYLTIFSTLPTLKEKDEIKLYYDGISYVYKIENMFEVQPTDIQILEQNPSDSFVTLVTCVPPGLKTRRLIVRARLVPNAGQLTYSNTGN